MNSVFRQCYDILLKVYRDNAYLNIIMKSNTNKRVAKIVFGVLDKHFELNYIIDFIVPKNVKPNIRPILLIGAYSLIFLQTPQNLVITQTNELLDSIGKSGVRSFISAVLLKVAQKDYELPKEKDKDYWQVKLNMPSWLIGMYRKNYPDNFESIINTPEFNKVHIIVNKNTTHEQIITADKNAIKTTTGYFVSNNKDIALMNFLGQISYMSLGSTLIAYAINAQDKQVLDSCAAPGGKAVFMALSGGKVTACDIHEHRVELIKSYANRMNVFMDIYQQDATAFVPKWREKFDVVLVDAPCSGLGVVSKKKDIILNRTYNDIVELTKLQQKILENASKYVKKGGILFYSTCTIFSMENSEIINAFLANNKDFSKKKIDLEWQNNGEIQFLPDGKGMEGFYLCQMIRN